MRIKRTGIEIKPDCSRVLLRPFDRNDEQRNLKIVARVQSLTEGEVEDLLAEVMSEFRGRHHKLGTFLLTRFEQVRQHLPTDTPLSENRRLLIGAYFTQEYALEAAALFNPSMVWHPDQSRLEAGTKRFIVSLRATGEGHISSITFRSGTIDAVNTISLDPVTPFVIAPEVIANAVYDHALFSRKLIEIGVSNSIVDDVLVGLPEMFTLEDLQQGLRVVALQHRHAQQEFDRTCDRIMTLAQSNYEVAFTPDQPLSERILFPTAPSEKNGIEDARWVQFREEDGRTHYYATYTAYNGEVTLPQIIETEDFLHFKISTLNGPEIRNKGMALFPRKINGHFAMISRQDNENIYLMQTDLLHFWYSRELILKPTFPWEFVQLGNCGSPIETDRGWLVLSHGVGPMRKYSIAAFLLDLDNPRKVLGRLRRPLLTPEGNEREGYVPNVVYSCGGLVHGEDIILPYAVSDHASSFAIIPLQDVLNEMV